MAAAAAAVVTKTKVVVVDDDVYYVAFADAETQKNEIREKIEIVTGTGNVIGTKTGTETERNIDAEAVLHTTENDVRIIICVDQSVNYIAFVKRRLNYVLRSSLYE